MITINQLVESGLFKKEGENYYSLNDEILIKPKNKEQTIWKLYICDDEFNERYFYLTDISDYTELIHICHNILN